MSLKLLACDNPEDILKIFEEEFIRGDISGLRRSPSGEELCIILKFLQGSIKNNLNREEARALLENDLRVGTIIDWMIPRYEALDMEYKISTTFAIGVLMSTFDYVLPSHEYCMKLIEPLVDIEVQEGAMELLPSMIFMLPCFINDDTFDLVGLVVEQLSNKFFTNKPDKLDLLNCALISLGWSRTDCRNEELAHQMFMSISE